MLAKPFTKRISGMHLISIDEGISGVDARVIGPDGTVIEP